MIIFVIFIVHEYFANFDKYIIFMNQCVKDFIFSFYTNFDNFINFLTITKIVNFIILIDTIISFNH